MIRIVILVVLTITVLYASHKHYVEGKRFNIATGKVELDTRK